MFFKYIAATANFPPAIRQNVSLTQEKCLVLQPSANGRESCVIVQKFLDYKLRCRVGSKEKSILILLFDGHS